MTHGLLVAAPRSGSGKTTVTLGLLAALRRRGVRVGAIKAGPDYLDTAFHAVATGRPGLNLDSWAMPATLLDGLFGTATTDADLVIAEGAMGLFDGIPGPSGRTGSAADLCARFGLPVLLVLDVSGQAQTAAAMLRGFATHDPAVRIGGVVLNRVGSERHRRLIAHAMASLCIPIAGAIPRGGAPEMPERHLGLVQAEEHEALPTLLSALADMAEQHLDLDLIRQIAGSLPPATASRAIPLPPPGQRIAVARDAAFSFLYGHVVEGWRRAGADLIPFSPLADEPPPADCDACWLPGGYPELHAGHLATASHFLDGLRAFAATRPVHGECGGFMVLGETLEDASGTTHRMAGLLSHGTSFAKRRLHLGYRAATLLADGPLGVAGAIVRGHEFHYARLVQPGDDPPLAELQDAEGNDLGPAGGIRGRVSGTFFHFIARTETPL
ncbi:MAG: cobyrinate a,c-diamide synthase [Proteobacteria bacterium]|nr:cobyrinate a,c-diamide synthase [Pseudomonadota bacterium]